MGVVVTEPWLFVLSMELTTGTGIRIDGPTAEQVAEVLAELPGGADSFAILASSEMTYIQTSGAPAEGFILEYQADSADHHFTALRDDLPLETVVEAFQRYAAGDTSWRSLVNWNRTEITAGSRNMLAPTLAVAVIAAAILWWWFAA
jgi:hypothetical protein